MGVVVGLDTSTSTLAVAARDGDRVLEEVAVGPAPDGRPRHSAALLAAVERCAAAAGGWERVERIAVGIGPGSFTGLRIGIASARALAQARSIELRGVVSLAAIARGMASSSSAPKPADRDPSCLLAVIDARRGQVFAALYDAAGVVIWEPFVATTAQLTERCAALAVSALAAGDGALRFRSELEDAGLDVPLDRDPVHLVSGRHVCALGAEGEAFRLDQIEPLYLREPDAEIWRQRDRKPRDG